MASRSCLRLNPGSLRHSIRYPIRLQSLSRIPGSFRYIVTTVPPRNVPRLWVNRTPTPTAPSNPQPSVPPTLRAKDITTFTSQNSNFSQLRQTPGHAYFDRSRYIHILNTLQSDTVLFLRPPGFGKSLTVSMVEYFHGVQHRDKYDVLFKDLDINAIVKTGDATPGEYLILRFDFSHIKRNPNLEVTTQAIGDAILTGVKNFYTQYHTYWGVPASKLISTVTTENPITSVNELVKLVSATLRDAKEEGVVANPLARVKGIYLLADDIDAFTNMHLDSWTGTRAPGLVRNFWAHVKYLMTLKFGIRKCFVTGVTPLVLDDTKGFTLAKDVSFRPEMAGVCGLTKEDVRAALERVCGEDEVERRVGELEGWADGYRFCWEEKVPGIYNTATALQYLQSVVEKTPISIKAVRSPVPASLLKICAFSSVAMSEIQNALATEVQPNTLQKPIVYTGYNIGITPADLYSKINKDPLAWRKLLLYFGGLTFSTSKAGPEPLLQIPNRIMARRLGGTILDRYDLRGSINDAVESLESRGDIVKALTCYRKIASERDHELSAYDWDEEAHRDSFHISILSNPALATQPEYKVIMPEITRQAGRNSRVDLLVRSQTHLVFTHWEAIGVDSLDFGDLGTRVRKQEKLNELSIDQLLNMRFNTLWYTRRYMKRMRIGATVESWLQKEVAVWMRGYVRTRRLAMCGGREFRACLVVVVGSRKILVWELDGEGNMTDVKVLI